MMAVVVQHCLVDHNLTLPGTEDSFAWKSTPWQGASKRGPSALMQDSWLTHPPNRLVLVMQRVLRLHSMGKEGYKVKGGKRWNRRVSTRKEESERGAKRWVGGTQEADGVRTRPNQRKPTQPCTAASAVLIKLKSTGAQLLCIAKN